MPRSRPPLIARLPFTAATAAIWTLLWASSAQALAERDARHLLARTGFAPSPAGIDRLAGVGRAAAVERLLDQAGSTAVTPAPDWVARWQPPKKRARDLTQSERKALKETMRKQAVELKAWWYREMVATPSPITEVMTLFWHGHFTSGLRKVKAPALLFRQNTLLRRHALGNFGDLLREIVRDPAMLLYLDGARSRRDAPNENFARELFELFTLGEGHYGERDVKDAARAFTGYSLDRRSGSFRFRARWHDPGEKIVLGRRGTFDGDDVVEILLAQPRTAQHIVEKLWRALVSGAPDPAEVERMAVLFRDSGYEIKPLLRALLSSESFWDEAARGRLIRSPVDLLVGTVRLFDIPVRDGRNLAMAGRLLGQDLFEPPNVKGWPGGTAWITSESLVERQAILSYVAGDATAMTAAAADKRDRGETRNGGKAKRVAAILSSALDRWVDGLPAQWSDAASIALLLAPLPPVDTPVLNPDGSAALVRQLLLDPVYQLE